MTDRQNIHFVDKLPPKRNWRSLEARRQALRIAQSMPKWGKLADYPPTDEGMAAASQRALSTPRSAAFKEVGTFEGRVRYDAHIDRLVVYIRCKSRKRDGLTMEEIDNA